MIKVDVWKDVLRILDSYLEMNNHRKTPERYTILKAIYNIDGHFSLDELGEKLVRDYNFPVSRATLYIYGICSTCSAKMTRLKNKSTEKSKKQNKI